MRILVLLLLLGATAQAEPMYKCVFYRTFADGRMDQENFRSIDFDPRSEYNDEEIGQIDTYVSFVYVYPGQPERLGIDLCNQDACVDDESNHHKIGDSFGVQAIDPYSNDIFSVNCKPQAKQ